MIKAVIIPPALDHPLRCAEIDPKDLLIYDGVIGGNRQVHELRNPAMMLYSNSVSKTPLNIRAMLMLWVHNRSTAYHTMISGQALLTGNVDGADADVPEIMELIFKAQHYKVEVNGRGDGMTYDELPFAYAAAATYHAVPSVESEVSLPAVIVAKVRTWCSG